MTHIPFTQMARYPSAIGERATERARITAEVHAKAAAFALKAGRSTKCRGEVLRPLLPHGTPWHSHEVGGCQNDGSSCICDCHDQANTNPKETP